MENKMNKFGFEKMLAVLAVAFTCVCMWGCSFEDGTHKEWAQFREGKKNNWLFKRFFGYCFGLSSLV